MARDGRTATTPACGRFYAPPLWADYLFCYQPKGHDGPCKFEARRKEAEARRA